ncbi:MAG: QacE family quaternary ammonium compound efflux SMR transporter [Polyangiaceae bacterium]|nr:QacE family quaternary ammonium compound efflux SMR transporter [Polyangiaceae bacterium]
MPHQSYLFLAIAIVSEVVATTSLKATEGFTRLWPTLLSLAGYGLAFYFMSRTMEHIPVGVTYAVWGGAGLLLVSLLAWWFFGQRPDLGAVLGMTLIAAGMVVMGLFSKSFVY